jgi:hypothetical protein
MADDDMNYDPHDIRPAWGKDLSGLALWLALLFGLSFSGGALPSSITPPIPGVVAGCGSTAAPPAGQGAVL